VAKEALIPDLQQSSYTVWTMRFKMCIWYGWYGYHWNYNYDSSAELEYYYHVWSVSTRR